MVSEQHCGWRIRGGQTNPVEGEILTPADGAAKYKELVGAAAARVQGMSDEKLAEELDFFGMMKLPAVVLLGVMGKHSIHHRGQLSAYLRPMGCKVPGIYGPSGDM